MILEEDPFISILDKSNEKGGRNIGAKCHNTVLWVAFNIFRSFLTVTKYLTVTDQKLVSCYKYISQLIIAVNDEEIGRVTR